MYINKVIVTILLLIKESLKTVSIYLFTFFYVGIANLIPICSGKKFDTTFLHDIKKCLLQFKMTISFGSIILPLEIYPAGNTCKSVQRYLFNDILVKLKIWK